MTSIEYGGGTTAEQRKAFCETETGGHIPGYVGFCPQMKYRKGKSFGRQTAEIARDIPYYDGPKFVSAFHLYPTVGKDKDAAVRSVFKDEVPGRMLPHPTGDNKYIEGMIPGYSGDVPRLNFKIGGTYRQLCDESVDEFIRDYKCEEKKREELREVSTLFPTLRPIANNPRVKNHMNIWADELARTSAFTAIRGPTEPPIPGYQGFIPRMSNTELGIAGRFERVARRSLESFRAECKAHYDRLAEPQTSINRESYVRSLILDSPKDKYVSSRIFRREGMIPDYVGHVHGFHSQIGKNYGDATRSLEVCSHHFPTYGEFVKDRELSATKYAPST